jgi:hypothetical protein
MFRIKVEPVPERGTYMLIKSVIIEGIKVPALFEWDGASIPFFLWPIIGSPFDPRFMAPSMIHDYLYATGKKKRMKADKLFRKLLIHNGVDKERADTMHEGVRRCGGSHYNRKAVTA